MTRPHIMVIDPAVRLPELECFNLMAQLSPLPTTYHLPCMQGMQSFAAEDMTQVKGIIILGSAASVHDRLPWQYALEAWLMPHLEARVPTLGNCYGHQMLAYMFGGKVEFAFPGQEKRKGFREVSVDETPAWNRGEGKMCISHCEAVTVAPASMKVVASSPEIAIDGLQHLHLPVFSLQAHPEAVPAFLRSHEIPSEGPDAFAFGHEIVNSFLKFASGHRR